MAQMRQAVLVLALLMPVAAGAQTQASVQQRGLAAEMAWRWHDALLIYLEALQQDPQQSSLWVRVADIQARLGHLDECIRALTHAASAAPRDASIHARLSEAYSEAQNAEAALAAIERAVALAPGSPDYLRRRAVLATWTGRHAIAQDSYERLLGLGVVDAEATLGLARVSAWAGNTDRAVEMYRRYLRDHDRKRSVWIELARAEAWRGNFAGSLDVLEQYRERFGASTEYEHERAAALARGGRPREASRLIDRLLTQAPDDYDLNVSKTVALAAQQRRRDALSSFEAVERLRPGQPETRDAGSLVRVSVASTGEPQASFYGDSDGLRIQRFEPRVNLALSSATRVDAGYDRAELRARSGSGLEQRDGGLDAHHHAFWAGVSQQAGPVTVRGRGGYASLEGVDRFIYGVDARFASDAVRLSLGRESGYLVVSPRTLDLGLTRLAHRAQLDWMPALRYHVVIDATYETLSDGNDRWDVLFGPRRSVTRTQWLNLDLGVQLRAFGASRDLDNGYYDPSRYESYLFAAYPYWKVSENTGLAAVLMGGAQRDSRFPSFRFGGNAALEATVGIYRDWMLRINGAYTKNDRLDSGAFNGYSAGAMLVRRF
jgi:tetratricopeptide (TPR) repeat protein